MLRTSPQAYAACAQALSHYDLQPAMARLQERIWLVAGEHDEDIPAHFAELANAYARARLAILPGVGHFPAVEAPEVFNKLLEEALTAEIGRPAQ